MRAFILRGGLTGPCFSDRASMAPHCGVWAGAMGKGDLSVRELNRIRWGIKRFVGTHRTRPGLLVERGWATPEGRES